MEHTSKTTHTTNPTQTPEAVQVAVIFEHLERWINQRAGLDPANYGMARGQTPDRKQWWECYRNMESEKASIRKDGRRARLALAEARSYPADLNALLESFRAFSGRLTWNGIALDYTSGQYWPTEYRAAAAVVLETYNHTMKPKHTPGGRIPSSIYELKQMVQATGSHWFDRASMKFFRCRVLPDIYSGMGGVFFVSSEQREDYTPRLFTVRRFDPKDGDVQTFGEFNEMSKAEAIRTAERAALSNHPLCDQCGGTGQKYQKDCWSCHGTGKRTD